MDLSDQVKKMMEEDEPDDDADSFEKISEAFICCICLDLLYKPIVLACGHMSCFWCVQRSMSGLRESHCPICRQPYQHFPMICKMLHFLLFKIYPASYKRRQTQILEYEKEKGSFSPQFDDPAFILETEKKLPRLSSAQESTVSEYDLLSHPSSSSKDQILLNVAPSESGSIIEENAGPNLQIAAEDVESTILSVDEEKKLQQRISSVNCHQISVCDVLCTLCKELLFRPIVLNCGHAYCESCIALPTNEMIRCHVCQIKHPGKAPKVCLELDDFLEEQLPIEYAKRRTSFQLKQDHLQQESSTTCSSEDAPESVYLPPSSAENLLSWWGDHKVHVGAGCDGCGMYPIIGDRHKCKECVEGRNYDLCGECYATGSKLPGRFNQQHTPEHTFEIMRPNSIRNIMLRLLRGQLEDTSAAPNPSPDTTENQHSSLSSDAQEAAGGGPATNDSVNQGCENERLVKCWAESNEPWRSEPSHDCSFCISPRQIEYWMGMGLG
ncbi:hypothetical protein M9H77_01206 [Catharanthus roseus]|uniref:Uncharacterized protein n=1 Tax=Catharanthus roseus TaxID=4058 RepID=A0ACC0C565_CATRO|nr:hypothetical protein M9H77_01206 [Catharanthus roseus]